MAKTPTTPKQSDLIRQISAEATAAALERCGVGEEGLDCVVDEHTSALHAAIRDFVTERLQEYSVPSLYRNEEVESHFKYPPEFKRVKSVGEQANILRALFSELRTAGMVAACRDLPPFAENWYVFPRWQDLARTYGEAVGRVFDLLSSSREFSNQFGKTSSRYLQQTAAKVAAFEQIGQQQEGHKLLVVPCQFGLRHCGRSIRRAHVLFPYHDEFGLGVFEVGIMILTHPERMIRAKQLHVDCAGDVVQDGGMFDAVSFFVSGGGDKGGRLALNRGPSNSQNACFGSASAFKL